MFLDPHIERNWEIRIGELTPETGFDGVAWQVILDTIPTQDFKLKWVLREPPLKRIGIDSKCLRERIDRKPPRVHAVIPRQDEAGQRARMLVEARKPSGGGECIPALRARIPSGRNRCRERVYIHSTATSISRMYKWGERT